VSWDVKDQLQGLRLPEPLVNVRIAAWLQTPDDNSTDPAVSEVAILSLYLPL
jgi:hypothetical protein